MADCHMAVVALDLSGRVELEPEYENDLLGISLWTIISLVA